MVVNLKYNTMIRIGRESYHQRKLAQTAGNQIAFTGSIRDDNAHEECAECAYGKCIVIGNFGQLAKSNFSSGEKDNKIERY